MAGLLGQRRVTNDIMARQQNVGILRAETPTPTLQPCTRMPRIPASAQVGSHRLDSELVTDCFLCDVPSAVVISSY